MEVNSCLSFFFTLNNIFPKLLNSAEELGNHFEGDLLLNSNQMQALLSKTGLRDTRYRWTNAVIPYIIDGSYSEYF